VILNDDPLNPSQAASDADRVRANEHTKTLASRKVDKKNTPTITIMQRLHEQDVTGYLLEKKADKIRHICLPAELSPQVRPESVRDKYVDGLLDPRRLDREILAEQKVDLGAKGYSGQYEQLPSPDGGNIIKKEWFQYIQPADFARIRTSEPIVFFGDTAFTDKSGNDPSGFIGTCAIGPNLYITSAKKVNLKFPDLIRFLPGHLTANGYARGSALRIEPKANGLSVIDQLKESTDLNVTRTPSPKESKETRLNAASPYIECGRVFLVAGSWGEDFTDEICGFPAKAHDEYVDLICYATDYHLKTKRIDTKGLSAAVY